MTPRVIFFDLDYTLYDLELYLRGALADVAQCVAEELSLDPITCGDSLQAAWRRLGTDHPRLFNCWLAEQEWFAADRVRRAIDVFHGHRPARLAFYPGALESLERLSGTYRMGLVTDGHLAMQQAKVAALDLGAQFDPLVYTAALGLSKPDPLVFEHALAAAGCTADEALFVGDHPLRDIAGARRAGIPAVRVATGEFGSLPDDPQHGPTFRLDSVRDLPDLLDRLR